MIENQEEIKRLREKRRILEIRIIRQNRELENAYELKNGLQNEMISLKLHYHEIDLALAKLDGRYQVIKTKEQKPEISQKEKIKTMFAQMSAYEKDKFLLELCEE